FCRKSAAALPPPCRRAPPSLHRERMSLNPRLKPTCAFRATPRRGGREKKPPSRKRIMARQFIYHMEGLSKTYPGNRKVLENINLSFYPDAKIGVLGVN